MVNDIGLVGSPSTTAKVTVDIVEEATDFPLRGQLVSLTHPLDKGYLIALGTVTEIKTHNRWHEDANMRGVLKRHGSLPHLSAVGDVRTADVSVQAVYLAENKDPALGTPPAESGGALSMSPTTGAQVHRITNDFLKALLRKHSTDIIYLGSAYGMDDVQLPLSLRHFGPTASGGSGEAYHIGVFGMTGSGKSGFASYMLAAYARHPELGILIMDPQGQFATEHGLPFSLQEWARAQGRRVGVLSVSQELRLSKSAPLLVELLSKTRFFRDLLTLRGPQPLDSATAEVERILRAQDNWDTDEADTLLRHILQALADDSAAIQRIYATKASQQKLITQISCLLDDPAQFQIALDLFRPLHSLFTATNLSGKERTYMARVLSFLLETDRRPRPLVIINLSSSTLGATQDADSPAAILDSTVIKARLLRELCNTVKWVAERRYVENKSLNTMIVFDEAQRFAAADPEEKEESPILADRLVEYVRSTRKYGLGWTFITQEVSSLRRGIYDQLRVRAFGYGLTSGSEWQRLRETIGDPEAIGLYRSFVDPQAIHPSQYPFMLTGPVSPLSFTGAPVFLSVYTDFEKFKQDNGYT